MVSEKGRVDDAREIQHIAGISYYIQNTIYYLLIPVYALLVSVYGIKQMRNVDVARTIWYVAGIVYCVLVIRHFSLHSLIGSIYGIRFYLWHRTNAQCGCCSKDLVHHRYYVLCI